MKPQRIFTMIPGIFMLALAVTAAAVTIPSGTQVTVRTSSTLNSGKTHSGASWSGTVASDLIVNGKVIAHSGDPVTGIVSSAKDSGRLHAPGQLAIRVTSINGIRVHSSTFYAKGKGHAVSNTEKIGGTAAVGAIIGALAGGGKGALIGAGAGAAAGTGLAAATGKEQAVINAESAITFTVSTSTSSSSSRTSSSH